MEPTAEYTGKERQPKWQRIILLVVLGYEAAGCLAGGGLLVAAPDGRLMDMPVDMMHGAFRDFLIPGIILIGLGILTTAAFVAVMRRTRNDWVMAGLALGALLGWFWIEIAILEELHWLHAMWGLPVVVGALAAIPLVPSRYRRKALLVCGILSSVLYVAINIYVPMQYEGYDSASQTVSELSAIDTPTRSLWVWLLTVYTVLVIAFGWGVWQSAGRNRPLRIAGGVMIVYAVIGIFWPPMHQREALAAGGGTLTDTLHIAFTMVTVPLMLLVIGFGAAALGKRFRLYSILTIVVQLVFGVLTGLQSPQLEADLPTPWMGVWERISIGAYMLWVVVLAVILLRKEKEPAYDR